MARKQVMVPGSGNSSDHMKEEIASEFGLQQGPETTGRRYDTVGGGLTRRLLGLAEISLRNQQGQ